MRLSLIGDENLDAMCKMAAGTAPGDFVELGVYKGGSAERLAKVAREQGRALWLFDSFTGIVERTEGIDYHQVGDFSDSSFDDVRQLLPDARIVVGDICKTLPMIELGPVAFVHLDVDQYETHRVAIAELVPRMVRGGVMWFDDYGGLAGATKAADEALSGLVQQHACGKSYVRF